MTINFIEEWICDGCGNTFDKTELVDSIQPPYYSCVDCEEDLIATTRKEDMEKLKEMEEFRNECL